MAIAPEDVADSDLSVLLATVAGGAIDRTARHGASVSGIAARQIPAHQITANQVAARGESNGVGPILAARLLAHFGSAERLCAATAVEMEVVEGVGSLRSRRLHRALRSAMSSGLVRRERVAMQRCGAAMIRLRDADYPPLLATIPDPPTALFVRGELLPSDRRAVAIVGARKCGAYGLAHAARLATGLSEAGYTIVSGGARGIDAAAHAAALRCGGRTIAVFGGGIGVCYPPEHAGLFEQIAATGALLSEMPCATAPRPEYFPRRNRIVSGLSLGVIVVEAARRSGALITARLAVEEHHREVMALPGSVDSPRSEGCHRAIREGWAGLVTNVDDVIAQLAGAESLLAAVADETAALRLNTDDQADQDGSEGMSGTGTGLNTSPCPQPDLQPACGVAPGSTEEAIARLLHREPSGLTASAIADLLDRPPPEILAAVTTMRLDGLLIDGSDGRVVSGRR